jgi:diguanylate cyclase (GGDEF)-like protein
MDSSWLIRDGMDRERMLDMDRRLQPLRKASLVVLAAALLACGPWLGWWTLAPLLLAGVLFSIAERHIPRTKRPEYALFAAWAASEVIIAATVALTGGSNMTISWLALPIVTLASRFSTRGIAAGVAIAIGLLLAVVLGTNADAVMHNPTLVIAPAALIVSVTILSVALARSDVDLRNRAVIDPLTGMLNRTALASRVEELAQQSAVSGEPVGVIMLDLDHFKTINDSLGHTAGDSVLCDLAYVLRRQLRAFDLAYRLGGEEFLVLLPGAELASASAIAEQLREVVEQEPLGHGAEVTISCGVSASERGSRFSYESVFAAADAALYEAKRAGRNRVCDGRAAAPALAG